MSEFDKKISKAKEKRVLTINSEVDEHIEYIKKKIIKAILRGEDNYLYNPFCSLRQDMIDLIINKLKKSEHVIKVSQYNGMCILVRINKERSS